MRSTALRIVLVIGGSKGVGRGYCLDICCSRPPSYGDLQHPAPRGLFGVSNTESVDEPFTAVEKYFYPVEVVVSNAGTGREPCLLMSEDDLLDPLNTDLVAGYRGDLNVIHQ